MDKHENDLWVADKYAAAQQAIVGADFPRLKELVKELTENGYVFAAGMLLKAWEDAGNVDV